MGLLTRLIQLLPAVLTASGVMDLFSAEATPVCPQCILSLAYSSIKR